MVKVKNVHTSRKNNKHRNLGMTVFNATFERSNDVDVTIA